MRDEIGVDLFTERVDGGPLRVAIGLGDAGILVHARHAHRELKNRLAHIGEADHRRGTARFGRTRERNMAFASK